MAPGGEDFAAAGSLGPLAVQVAYSASGRIARESKKTLIFAKSPVYACRRWARSCREEGDGTSLRRRTRKKTCMDA